MRLQETDEAAKVVLVPMAEHDGDNGRRVNTEQARIVEKCFRRETEIHQDVARLVAAPRLDMHRKAEFADQRFARRLVAKTPAKVLDIEVRQLSARGDSELIAIDHYPDCHAVER